MLIITNKITLKKKIFLPTKILIKGRNKIQIANNKMRKRKIKFMFPKLIQVILMNPNQNSRSKIINKNSIQKPRTSTFLKILNQSPQKKLKKISMNQ